MPAIANIVVADATPTNHTLVPQSASLALSQWMEATATNYEGNARVAMGMSLPTSQRPTTRNTLQLAVPMERTVEGVIVVEDVVLFNVSQVLAKTCSAAEALKAYTMFKNLVAHATVQSYFAGREPVY